MWVEREQKKKKKTELGRSARKEPNNLELGKQA